MEDGACDSHPPSQPRDLPQSDEDARLEAAAEAIEGRLTAAEEYERSLDRREAGVAEAEAAVARAREAAAADVAAAKAQLQDATARASAASAELAALQEENAAVQVSLRTQLAAPAAVQYYGPAVPPHPPFHAVRALCARG